MNFKNLETAANEFKKIADECSKKIVETEKVLRLCDVNLSFCWQKHDVFSNKFGFAWDLLGPDKSKFRLLFIPMDPDTRELDFSKAKPFIDQKLSIRMEYIQYLDEFIDAYTEFVKNYLNKYKKE